MLCTEKNKKKNPKHIEKQIAFYPLLAFYFAICFVFCGIWHLLRAFALNNLLYFTLDVCLYAYIWKQKCSASTKLRMRENGKMRTQERERSKKKTQNLYLHADKCAWNFSFCALCMRNNDTRRQSSKKKKHPNRVTIFFPAISYK